MREYVYYPETFEPLALIEGARSAQRVYHYHNDPNGCPTRLTDASGEVKWAASYTAWGQISKLHVNGVDNPIRLQGQYEDEETGFYSNYHRYYDPVASQYISSDPLGCTAGENIYQLAPNTSSWIDPLGLSCKHITLGLDPFYKTIPGYGTSVFGYKRWAEMGITRRKVTVPGFGRAFHQATKRTEHIHFALDRIADSPDALRRAIRSGKAGFSHTNITNAELHHIVTNPDLFNKTTFYRGGKPLTPDETKQLFDGLI